MKVDLNDVGKSYGAVPVITGVTLELRTGESVVVHGANGCGKSTLANIVAGLDVPSQGQSIIRDTSTPRPTVGYVFQDYGRSLLPWFSVLDNIILPMRLLGAARGRCAEHARALLKTTGLGPLPLDRFPYQLSGGQQQRAAILRALVASEEFIILDEPFSSLDQRSNRALQDMIQRLRLNGRTLILSIIHDLDDAIFLADRVICLGGSPTTVQGDIPVPIPWPRAQETRIDEGFLIVRRQVMTAMGIVPGQAT